MPEKNAPLTGEAGALAALHRLYSKNAEGMKRLANTFLPLFEDDDDA